MGGNGSEHNGNNGSQFNLLTEREQEILKHLKSAKTRHTTALQENLNTEVRVAHRNFASLLQKTSTKLLEKGLKGGEFYDVKGLNDDIKGELVHRRQITNNKVEAKFGKWSAGRVNQQVELSTAIDNEDEGAVEDYIKKMRGEKSEVNSKHIIAAIKKYDADKFKSEILTDSKPGWILVKLIKSAKEQVLDEVRNSKTCKTSVNADTYEVVSKLIDQTIADIQKQKMGKLYSTDLKKRIESRHNESSMVR